jgi:hypothetical protein
MNAIGAAVVAIGITPLIAAAPASAAPACSAPSGTGMFQPGGVPGPVQTAKAPPAQTPQDPPPPNSLHRHRGSGTGYLLSKPWL